MKTTDIIVFCGQSNMQGQTERLSENEIVSGAFEYKFLGNEFVPLQNPVGEDICYDGTRGEVYSDKVVPYEWHITHALGSSSSGHTNLVPSFCRSYIKHTNSDVIAVHAAKGSTDISCWLPSAREGAMMLEKAKAAISKAKAEFPVRHIFFVWLQGESDAIISRSKAEYKENLSKLGKFLRDELSVEKFGIIRVGKFTRDERDFEIISAQDEICLEDDFFLMLTDAASKFCEECGEMMNPLVAGHYSAAGLETLGSLSGDTLGKFVCR